MSAGVGASQPEEEESKEVKACRSLLAVLMRKLDALAHFQFAPPPMDDMQVQAPPGVSAMALEEMNLDVGAVRHAAAPKDVYKNTLHGAPLRDRAEMTHDERRTERRKKKRQRRGSEVAQNDLKRKLEEKARAEASAKKAEERSGKTISSFGKSRQVFQMLEDARQKTT